MPNASEKRKEALDAIKKQVLDPAKSNTGKWMFLIIGVVLGGVAVGAILTSWETITRFQPYIVGGAVGILLVLVVGAFLFFLFKRSIYHKIFGATFATYDETAGRWIQNVLPFFRGLLPSKTDEEFQRLTDEVASTGKQLVGYWGYLLFRREAMQLIFTMAAFVGGLLTTMLLIQQNQLITTQNKFIKEQSSLSEGARRSSLVFLMGEIMQAVNEELKDKPTTPYHKDRKLSPQLIARIAALSHSLKPYRYLDSDTLIPKPLSPERGQLLINIAYLKLDTVESLTTIFMECNFAQADLIEASMKNTYLRGVNLKYADMRGILLENSDLREANMNFSDLTGAKLKNTDLRGTYLQESDLRVSDLEGADLRAGHLEGADLRYTNLKGTDLSYTNLSRAIVCKDLCNWFELIKEDKVIGYEKIINEYEMKENVQEFFFHEGQEKAFHLISKFE